MICISLADTSHEKLLAQHRDLAEQGATLVELRLDYLSDFPDLNRLLTDRPTRTIVTCRRQQDGGRWAFSEEDRLTLLRSAVAGNVEYVDLETDTARQIPRSGKTQRIISYHNFDETPAELRAIQTEMCEHDPDILKLVTMAHAPSDMVRLLKMVHNSSVPMVGFCMGELGLASRVLCGKFGAPFTYAAYSSDCTVAPGQIAFEVMRTVYHYDAIDSETQIFGVLGDPIAHSLSPLIHNAAFQHESLNCVYLPFRVPADSFSETLDAFEWFGCQGYSVTIPHKQAVLAIAAHCDKPVQDMGAANTLFRNANGDWQATNTDYQAALESLQLGLQNQFGDASLQGRRVLMLGAGGVARAIGMAVLQNGADLVIANRTRTRAVTLAKQLSCRYVPWEHRGTEQADILINCTSVGMHPRVDETPFPADWFQDGMLVFDTIYNPEETLLLTQARDCKCQTVSGMEMFVRQAAKQFELFTDRLAPIALMRQMVRHGLSARA